MNKEDNSFFRRAGMLSTMVLTPVFAVIIGFFIGLELDRWLHTSPWLTGLFVILGFVAGFRELIRLIRRSQKMLEEDDRKNGR